MTAELWSQSGPGLAPIFEGSSHRELRSAVAVKQGSQLQGGAQGERGALRISGVADGAQHAYARSARVEHGHHVLAVDAPDREERDVGVGGGVGHQLGADRGASELGGCGMDGTHADVVHMGGTIGCGWDGRVDLRWRMRGQSDQHVWPHDFAGLRDGHVALAHVNAVGAYRRGDVGAVVENEQGPVGIAGVGRHRGRFGEELVLEVLLAQLHHVHTARDRGRQEVREVAVAGHAVAHEVQARGRQARAALLAGWIGYGPQVGHRTPVLHSERADPAIRPLVWTAHRPVEGGGGERWRASSIKVMTENGGSTVDLAVLGGGIVGLSVAWRARAQGMSVAVFERGVFGEGATHVAAGMLAPVAEVEFGEDGRRMLDMAMRSAETWPNFAAELEDASGVEVGLRRSGTLVVARDEDEARELERQLAFRERLGLSAVRMRASEARAHEPALAPTVRLALHAPEDHSVDPRLVVSALRVACERAGVQLREHTPVCGLELNESETRVLGVKLGGEQDQAWSASAVVGGDVDVDRLGGRGSYESVQAGDVVVAMGAWSGLLGGLPDGVGADVRPVKGQIMRLRDPTGPGLLGGVVRFQGGYLVPRGDGRYVLGATVEERGFEPEATAGGIYELLRDAHELVPGVSELRIEEIGVGYRPGTPNNLPLVGAGALEGLTWATGHHRNGILLAPLTAELVTRGLAGEDVKHERVPS
jgi:glycine oxidase